MPDFQIVISQPNIVLSQQTIHQLKAYLFSINPNFKTLTLMTGFEVQGYMLLKCKPVLSEAVVEEVRAGHYRGVQECLQWGMKQGAGVFSHGWEIDVSSHGSLGSRLNHWPRFSACSLMLSSGWLLSSPSPAPDAVIGALLSASVSCGCSRGVWKAGWAGTCTGELRAESSAADLLLRRRRRFLAGPQVELHFGFDLARASPSSRAAHQRGLAG